MDLFQRVTQQQGFLHYFVQRIETANQMYVNLFMVVGFRFVCVFSSMASVCFSSTQEALDNVSGVRFRFNDAKDPDEVSKANSRMKALSSVTAAALAFATLGGSIFKPKLSDDTSNEEQHVSNVDVCFDDDETAAKRARVTTSAEDEYLRLQEMQQK